MNKFIINLVLFLPFAAIFYAAILFIWGYFAPAILKPNLSHRVGAYGHTYSRLSEVKNYPEVDILFVGSSHTYRGFDTRIFKDSGYRSFNLGTRAQTPTQTKVLLNRYLEKLKPKVVIYEVYPPTFAIDGVESSLDLIANDKNDFNSVKMALRINNIKTYNTLIYGILFDFFKLNNFYNEPKIKEDDTYISGGFVEKKLAFYELSEFEKREFVANPYQLESFSEIVKNLRSKNIDLILIYAPIPKVNYDSYNNTPYFDNLMKSYSKYFNFNDILPLDDSTHFYDSHHLNQNGVVVFNKKLIEILNREQNLNPRGR